MAEHSANPGGTGAETIAEQEFIEPSVLKAFPHFLLLLIFPLAICAALYGGWWLLGPFLFISLENFLDLRFGTDKRNMDPWKTSESQLYCYNLALWIWALLYPVVLVFVLWQVLVSGHLAVWESVIVVMGLAIVSQMVFIVGHEFVHRRSVWERRFGEFLLASVTYPHYATEHVYVHHPQVGTPADLGSAPKGQSFWEYFPRDVANNIIVAWRFERDRLARRQLPIWHYTNPFWRYTLLVAAWYALGYWIGGIWGLLIFPAISSSAVLSMKSINYVQHYGLQRIRLPNGRFERPQPKHSWSSDYRFFNWLYYNAQRHADHHAAATRSYPLLQHWGEDESPQLPAPYVTMGSLAVVPRLWFKTMDPLVDRWRAHFYPQIKDWSVYDSPAFKARPDAYEAVAEIMGASPRFSAWINRSPELLDSLQDREFTDLDLPDGFGPNPEFELIARRGLTRVYWTLEFCAPEMKEQVFDTPVQDANDAVEILRNWSNDKVFQVVVHTLRGNLSPMEAGTALSNIAEASIAGVLAAVVEDFTQRRAEGGVAAVILGDLACGEATVGVEPDIMFLYDGGSPDYYGALCERFLEALRAMSRDNLLLLPIQPGQTGRTVRSLADFADCHHSAGSTGELRDLMRSRCVFTSGDAGLGKRFEETRHEILTNGVARDALISELHETVRGEGAGEPGLGSFEDVRGGLHDVARAARFLQVTHAGAVPDMIASDTVSVFQSAGEHELIPDDAAERLAETARTWRNLRAILRLLAEDDSVDHNTCPVARTVIARACGTDDFDALTVAIKETTSRAAGDIDALYNAK
ncbi:MAG: fatty acid desaturase [Gammaproteobacteria bacterium]|nr:fatty acid desaturase [Gammaproteobacteria bacterium]